jgi:hypothetical protein
LQREHSKCLIVGIVGTIADGSNTEQDCKMGGLKNSALERLNVQRAQLEQFAKKGRAGFSPVESCAFLPGLFSP